MENGNTVESQKSELKFKRFSKRNIYMKKKIAEDKNKQNEEPKENPKEELREESKEVQKEEEKIIQVNKITTKKDNNPYNHKTNPKFKVKNNNIEENNDINQNVKESKRYKSPTTLSNKETIKEQKNVAKNINLEINKDDKIIEDNKDDSINDKINEVNNNENQITVNLKKDNDIKNDNDSNIKSNENKNMDNDNINQDIKDIKTEKKINSNSDLKISNINLISPEADIDTNSNSKEKEKESETKNNKARNKLDIIKDPSKSLLSGGPKKECPQCHALIESHLYKIHVKNVHLSQILSWLYLGSFANACDLDELKRNNIKYILNCAVECKNENLPSDIKELHLKLVDEPEFDITKHFKQTNDFINKVRTAGGNLLVHCKVGLSRSPTVIIAYLIKYYEFTADSAINFIKRKRPQIIPNQGFIKQLYEYEKQFEKKFKKKAKK